MFTFRVAAFARFHLISTKRAEQYFRLRAEGFPRGFSLGVVGLRG